MAFARDEYTATASQTDFTITFPFLDSDHIKVFQNEVELAAFTVPDSTTMRLDSGAASGDDILIYRETPKTELVAFSDGVPVTEENIDTLRKQLTYIVEELQDDFEVPSVAARVKPVQRTYMTDKTLALDASTMATNAANTVAISAVKETIGNTPSQFSLPGSDAFRPEAGLWICRVSGQAVRTDTGSGAISFDWDLVDQTAVARVEMNESSVYLGEPLGTDPDDRTPVHFSGSVFLNLSSARSYRLQAAKDAGADGAQLQNVFIEWIRLGDAV